MCAAPQGQTSKEADEEDDYMNMTFEEQPVKETSLQKTQRLKKESRERGRVKSRQELAQEVEAERDKALSTSLMDNPKNKKSKGLAMMAKMGFAGGSLGKKDEDGKSQGIAEPIKVTVKEGRAGIGIESKLKREREEAAEGMDIPSKVAKTDPDEFRERMRKERETARLEAQLWAAQRLAERLDSGGWTQVPLENEDDINNREEKLTEQPLNSRPIRSLPVEYRGLFTEKEEQKREDRRRRQVEESLTCLPTYESEDDEEESDYRIAFNKTETAYANEAEEDGDDKELEQFNELELGERLNKLLLYLRSNHNYCFWCKMAYPDKEMKFCPGVEEEEHD